MSETANDPVWQSSLNAPPGPAETEEQRRWSAEAELEERSALPEGVLRAVRDAGPGRPDTEKEKELFARRRLEASGGLGPDGVAVPLCADTAHRLPSKAAWIPTVAWNEELKAFVHVADEQQTEEERRLVEEAHTCSGCGAKYPEAMPERCGACGTTLHVSHAEVLAHLDGRYGSRGGA